MGIVEAVAVAEGDERGAGGGELLAGLEGALEGHEVGVIEDADADPAGVSQPAISVRFM